MKVVGRYPRKKNVLSAHPTLLLQHLQTVIHQIEIYEGSYQLTLHADFGPVRKYIRASAIYAGDQAPSIDGTSGCT